jgi:hypothetical protein
MQSEIEDSCLRPLVQDNVAGRTAHATPVHLAAISFLHSSNHGVCLRNLDTVLNENLFMPFSIDDKSADTTVAQTCVVCSCTVCTLSHDLEEPERKG